MDKWQQFGPEVTELKNQGFTYSEIANQLKKKYLYPFTGAMTRRYYRTYQKNVNQNKKQKFNKEFPKSEPAIEDRIEGNTRSIVVDGHSQIRTVEDLIDAANVDLDEWMVVDQKIKTWNGFHKNSYKETVVVQLFSIAIKMLPRTVEAVSANISPIVIKSSKYKKSNKDSSKKYPNKERMALAFFDPHIGFRRDIYNGELIPSHDRNALDATIRAANGYDPDMIVFAGDLLDLAEWSTKWTSDPGFVQTTQMALIEAAWYLNQVRQACPDATIKLLEGNHDKRFMELQKTNMPEAYGLKAVDEMHLPPALSIPRLLSLHVSDIEYIDGYPTNSVKLNDTLYVMHGHKVRSGATASVKALLQDTTVSILHGHTHRSEHAGKNYYNGEGLDNVEVWSSGCLCHVDGRVPGSNRQHNWQQGFLMATYFEKDYPPPNIYDIKLHDGWCSVLGDWISGSEETYLNKLRSDTGIDF